MRKSSVNVLIVGAGPAGLAAAHQLARLGIKDVLVMDREKQAGGTPRLCHHSGFGMRDLHRLFSGPSYAQHYVRKVQQAGVKLQTESSITGWQGSHSVCVTSPAGLEIIQANAILLATGCRERPRAAQLVPGARPKGVYTTGSLQDFVHGHHRPVGKKAVIVGSELVSISAIHTLKKAKCEPLCMLTEHAQHQVYMPYIPYKWWTANIINRVPLYANSQLVRILGREVVQAVAIMRSDNGKEEVIPCDTVVFSGNWIPDHELARMAQIEMNPQTNGPLVDTQYRTLKKGVFAAGNLLRGIEPADSAALEGRMAAHAIHKYLETNNWIDQKLSISAEGQLLWVVPTIIPADAVALQKHFLLRVKEFVKNPTLTVVQNGVVVYKKTFARLGPNYSFKLAGGWVGNLKSSGDVSVKLSS